MASLPTVNQIRREDIPNAPSWIDKVLDPLNQFMEGVYSALNRNLTFTENSLAQKQIFEVVAGASASACTAKFLLTMKVKPFTIFLTVTPKGALGDTFSPSFTWNYDGASINITSISGLTSGTTYSAVALLV